MEIPLHAQPFFSDEETYRKAWDWYCNWFPTELSEQIEDKTMSWEKFAKRWRKMNTVCVVEEW